MFIKVGRIYGIKPKPIPFENSKVRPAIALCKYDAGKTIFVHLGSSEYAEADSKACLICCENLGKRTRSGLIER